MVYTFTAKFVQVVEYFLFLFLSIFFFGGGGVYTASALMDY